MFVDTCLSRFVYVCGGVDESRALSPVSWRMALVMCMFVQAAGRVRYQQFDFLMIF